MQYIATINTPGYLPDSDEPALSFSTPREAWEHLADEREEAFDQAEVDPAGDSALTLMGQIILGQVNAEVGTVTGTTPGYDGDHDLGLAYTVTAIPGFRCVDCGDVFDNTDTANAHWAEVHDR